MRRLADDLWMWGHDTGHYDGPVNYARHDYNIPWSAPITMADACREMGIPNCCVIRPGMPPPPDDYLKPFARLDRISWLLWNSTREYCETKAVGIPNIAAFDLDDFFHAEIVDDVKPDGTKVRVMEGVMKLKEIAETRKSLSDKAGHPVELRMVLYAKQLKPEIMPAVEMMDKVLFWTWDGKDVMSMADNILKFRSYAPDKPILLGLYMWDFGGHRPIARAFMQSQLDLAERLYKEGIVEGLIFHCTPLVNKNLEAVEMARAWIAQHRNDVFASQPRSEIVLVDRGVAKCRVVVAPDADELIRKSADDIRRCFAESTGCGALDGELTIRLTTSEAGGRSKVEGGTKDDKFLCSTPNLTRQDAASTAFDLITTAEGVCIIGESAQGVRLGCQELLRRCVGMTVDGDADGKMTCEKRRSVILSNDFSIRRFVE